MGTYWKVGAYHDTSQTSKDMRMSLCTVRFKKNDKISGKREWEPDDLGLPVRV